MQYLHLLVLEKNAANMSKVSELVEAQVAGYNQPNKLTCLIYCISH